MGARFYPDYRMSFMAPRHIVVGGKVCSEPIVQPTTEIKLQQFYDVVRCYQDATGFRNESIEYFRDVEPAQQLRDGIALGYLKDGWSGSKARNGSWSFQKGGHRLWLRIRTQLLREGGPAD